MAYPFEREKQRKRNHLRWIQFGLRILLIVIVLCQFIIYTTEQVCDKIYRGHGLCLPPVNRVWCVTPINDTREGNGS